MYMHVSVNGQSSYRFEPGTGTYSEFSDGKRISFALMDTLNGFYRVRELEGEPYKWYNTLFKIDSIKTIHIQPYGNLRFDNDSSLIIVDGAFMFLDSIDQTSSISYKIIGNKEDRLLKVQWKNLRARSGKPGNFVNLQIWVYQRSGVFEVHYGPSSATNQSGFDQSNGPQIGIFYSLDDFTKCFEKLWVYGKPHEIKLDTLANYSFRAMLGVPGEGVVFRFVPKFKGLAVHTLETGNDHMMTYPNPVTGDMLYINRPGNYRIYDSNGKTILQAEATDMIDVSALSEGIYSLLSDEGIMARFIVQR